MKAVIIEPESVKESPSYPRLYRHNGPGLKGTLWLVFHPVSYRLDNAICIVDFAGRPDESGIYCFVDESSKDVELFNGELKLSNSQ